MRTAPEGLWEHDIVYTAAPGTEWEWLRVKVTGGKTNFWGRSSPRFAEIDFRAASLDGFDVDWPLTYEEIAPYYSRVERYIGVASTVQNRPSNPDGEYLPPMKFRCLHYILAAGAEKLGVPYLLDRIAQLTVPHGSHPRCHFCGDCGSGCDTGSFFSPSWFTLAEAEKTGRLELRTNAIACDHLYGTSASGFLPQLVGQPPFPDHVSASTIAWMPRWQNLKNPREEKFIRGYSVYPGGGRGEFPHFNNRFEEFASRFKRDIKRYYPAPAGFTIQAPSLPSRANYVDIDPEVKDVFGIPALRFHFQWGPNELMMWEHSKDVCREVLRAAGGEYWGAGEKPQSPGYSQHETGTARMGSDAKKFVTNKYAQCHDVPNLYLCDASIFPFCTDKTTTLGILAFALRTCEYWWTTCAAPEARGPARCKMGK